MAKNLTTPATPALPTTLTPFYTVTARAGRRKVYTRLTARGVQTTLNRLQATPVPLDLLANARRLATARAGKMLNDTCQLAWQAVQMATGDRGAKARARHNDWHRRVMFSIKTKPAPYKHVHPLHCLWYNIPPAVVRLTHGLTVQW